MTVRGSMRKGDNPFPLFFDHWKSEILIQTSLQVLESDSEDIYAIIYSQMPIEDEIHGQILLICQYFRCNVYK